MDRTADEFTPLGIPWHEAVKRAGSLDALRPCLHLGLIPVRHGSLFTWPEGQLRSGPGEIRPGWWHHAYEDRAGRMMFFTESVFWPESGVVAEQLFAYVASIELDSVAFEMCFPTATGPTKSDGMRAAQESIPEQNAETASSASAASSPTAPQTEPESPQTVATEEPPRPREQPGKSTVGSAGGETAPAPASVADASAPVANTEAPAAEPPPVFVADEEAAPAPAGAPAPVQSGPEAQPKPDKQSDEPTDPAALTDFIFRELTAMPHAHFKNGCLLQDLIEYLFEAVQLDKDAAGLPRVELFKSISKGIARAALAGHGALKGHPDDPSGQVRPIPPATLPSFLFNEWNRSRLIVDGPSTIWHGVTVWRSEVEAPDTESDLGEPTPDVASTDPADGRRSSAAPQTEPEPPAPKSVPTPTPTPPITADDWFWKAREAHPRQPREKTGEYARRLEKSMPQSEAGVKKPWDIRTIIRRLQEQRKAEVEAAAQKGRRPTGDR